MAQRVPVSLVGPSNKASSSHQQSGRRLNLYVEANDPDSKAVAALHSAPGTLLWGSVTESPIRGQLLASDRFFAIAGPKIYEFRPFANGDDYASPTSWGTIPTTDGRVCMVSANGYVIIGDGTQFSALQLSTGTISPVLNNSSEVIRGTFCLWIDGVVVYIERDSGQFRYSDLNAPTTVNGLSYMTAEGDPDNIVAGLVLSREMLLFGERTVEGFVYTGDTGNAFSRISGAFLEYGCLARWSVQKFDNSAVWVGKNADGEGVVWRLGSAGAPPQRISSHAVEKAIRDYLQDDESPEHITAYVYQELGHTFYVLNIGQGDGSITWAYDAATGLWHERAWLNRDTGKYERVKQDFATYWNKRHRCGSYDTGNIWTQSKAYFDLNGVPLVRLVESGHLHFSGRRFSLHELHILAQTGTGVENGTQGTDPQAMLQYRWDNKPWSNETWRDFGAVGTPETQLRWHRLAGGGRDFFVRFSVSDPVDVTLLAANALVSVAA